MRKEDRYPVADQLCSRPVHISLPFARAALCLHGSCSQLLLKVVPNPADDQGNIQGRVAIIGEPYEPTKSAFASSMGHRVYEPSNRLVVRHSCGVAPRTLKGASVLKTPRQPTKLNWHVV
jgi:hypothetical protein